MKIAGIIFSVFIFTLNAIPCCWDSCEDEDPVEQHAANEQNCSPFLSCGSCTGFVLQEELPEIILYNNPLASAIEFPEQVIFFEYSETIWQPPKQVMNLGLTKKEP